MKNKTKKPPKQKRVCHFPTLTSGEAPDSSALCFSFSTLSFNPCAFTPAVPVTAVLSASAPAALAPLSHLPGHCSFPFPYRCWGGDFSEL